MSERKGLELAAYIDGKTAAKYQMNCKYRRCAVGTYEHLESQLRGWMRVDDPAEAIAYLEGYEEGKKL